MSNTPTDRIIEALWPKGDGPTTPAVYALLDGARDPRIAPLAQQSGMEFSCLYSGKCSERLLNAAPYLVPLSRDRLFTRSLIDQSWGQSWGIFTIVPRSLSLKQQRDHFRSLLRVRDEAGRKLVFRFYDPRVLRVYLPTCTGKEARQFFGPIPRIMVEDQDADGIIGYRQTKGGVKSSLVPMTEAPETPRYSSAVV